MADIRECNLVRQHRRRMCQGADRAESVAGIDGVMRAGGSKTQLANVDCARAPGN
jgi:hypothetical protein